MSDAVRSELPGLAPLKSLPRYLTIDQVAEFAGVSRRRIYNATSDGELPRVSRCKFGFKTMDVLAWLERRGQLPDEYRYLLPA